MAANFNGPLAVAYIRLRADASGFLNDVKNVGIKVAPVTVKVKGDFKQLVNGLNSIVKQLKSKKLSLGLSANIAGAGLIKSATMIGNAVATAIATALNSSSKVIAAATKLGTTVVNSLAKTITSSSKLANSGILAGSRFIDAFAKTIRSSGRLAVSLSSAFNSISRIPGILAGGQNSGKSWGGGFIDFAKSIIQGAMGTFLGILGAMGFNSLIDASKRFVASMIDSNAQLEKMQTSLEVLFQSKSIANKMFKDVIKMASTTPFETPDLIRGIQTLKQFGHENKRLLPLMRSIGDAAASSPMGMEDAVHRMTYAFGQIKAAGKLLGQDLRQLTEVGVPAMKILEEQFGKSFSEIQKDVNSGKISIDTAIEAITTGMDKRFGGMMAKQSKSFYGLMSTMRDEWFLFAAEVGKPLFEAVKANLVGFLKYIKSPDFIKFRENLTEIITETVKWGGILSSITSTGLGGMVSGFNEFYDNTKFTIANLEVIWKIMWNKATKLAYDGLFGITGTFDALGGTIKEFVGFAIRSFETMFTYLTNAARDSIDAAGKGFDLLIKKLSGTATAGDEGSFFSAAGKAINSLKKDDILSTIASDFASTSVKSFQHIQDSIQAKKDASKEYQDVLKEESKLSEKLQKRAEFFQHQKQFKESFKAAKSFVTNISDKLSTAFSGISDLAQSAFVSTGKATVESKITGDTFGIADFQKTIQRAFVEDSGKVVASETLKASQNTNTLLKVTNAALEQGNAHTSAMIDAIKKISVGFVASSQ